VRFDHADAGAPGNLAELIGIDLPRLENGREALADGRGGNHKRDEDRGRNSSVIQRRQNQTR